MKKLASSLLVLVVCGCGIFVSQAGTAKWQVRCDDRALEWICETEQECKEQADRLEALKKGRVCIVEERGKE